jgi:signal transduction histidine kinase
MLDVEVTDPDEGIAPEPLERAFDRFYRVAGMGLAIARVLAELRYGRLTAASTPAAGTTFTLWRPWRRGGRSTPSFAS